ncbi:hypothetical protein C2G38_2136607 [Gigaspora rosea]|uniref:Uncharacterized protein n=1 Tax=Gigaspora rosea TaxID=44941 RepID=A0A397WB61_9GLOM|nr:hypothetical protein C2G38_2136607 [Gigaspora rosea]
MKAMDIKWAYTKAIEESLEKIPEYLQAIYEVSKERNSKSLRKLILEQTQEGADDCYIYKYISFLSSNKSSEIELNDICMMKKYKKELLDINKLLKVDSDNAFALCKRGAIYRSMNRHDGALLNLNKSLNINPYNELALSNRGVIYRIMNRNDEALLDLNKSLDINPYNPLALSNRGAIYRI